MIKCYLFVTMVMCFILYDKYRQSGSIYSHVYFSFKIRISLFHISRIYLSVIYGSFINFHFLFAKRMIIVYVFIKREMGSLLGHNNHHRNFTTLFYYYLQQVDFPPGDIPSTHASVLIPVLARLPT